MKKHAIALLITASLLMISFDLVKAQSPDENQEIILIEGFIADGLYPQAIARLDSFLERYPTSASAERARYLLGVVHFRSEDFARAAEIFSGFLADHSESPDVAQARYLLASAYQFQDDYAGAKRELNLLARDRDIDDELRFVVYQRRATVHLMLGEQQSARNDLREALDIRDDQAERLRLANLLYEMGEFRDAEREFQRLIDAGIRDETARQRVYSRYALVRYQREDYQDVVEFLAPRIRQYLDDEVMVGTLAWSYYKLGQYQQAYELYNNRVLSEETRFEQRLTMARQLLMIGEYQSAISSLNTLAEDFPQASLRSKTLEELSQAYLALGDIHNGVATLQQLVQLVPDEQRSFEIYKIIGDLSFNELGDINAASLAYIRALNNINDGEGVDAVKANLIDCYLKRGDTSAAQNRILDFINQHEDSEHYERILFLAGELYERGDSFDLALEHYRKIAQLRSTSPYRKSAYLAAFALVERLQRWPEIVRIGNEFLSEFPEEPNQTAVMLSIAKAYYMQEDYRDGIELLEVAFANEQDHQSLAMMLDRIAWGYYRLGELTRAEQYYQQVYDEYADTVYMQESLYWLGWLANVRSDLTVANQRFNLLVDRYPDSEFAEVALFQLAQNSERADQPQEAISYLERLVNSWPQGDYSSQARAKLIELAIAQGDYQAAVVALPQFQQHDPLQLASPDNLYERANSMAQSGNLDAALEVFLRLQTQYPDSPMADEVTFNIATIYHQQKRTRSAAQQLSEFLKQFPDSDKEMAARYLLGQNLMSMRRFDGAIEQLSLVLAVNNDQRAQETLNYMLAICHEQDGNMAAAADHYIAYLNAIGKPAENLPRRMEIAAFLLGQDRFQEVIKELQRIINNTSDDSMEMNAQYLIGQAYEEWGQLDQAAAEYLKVTYAHNSAPAGALMARMRAGRIYEELGRDQEAAVIYQTIVRNHAGSSFARIATIRLQAMGLQ